MCVPIFDNRIEDGARNAMKRGGTLDEIVATPRGENGRFFARICTGNKAACAGEVVCA
jgi:hypothetical protein